MEISEDDYESSGLQAKPVYLWQMNWMISMEETNFSITVDQSSHLHLPGYFFSFYM